MTPICFTYYFCHSKPVVANAVAITHTPAHIKTHIQVLCQPGYTSHAPQSHVVRDTEYSTSTACPVQHALEVATLTGTSTD